MKHRVFLFLFIISVLSLLIIDEFTDFSLKNLSDEGKQIRVKGIVYKHVRAKENEFTLVRGTKRYLLKFEDIDEKYKTSFSKGVRAEVVFTPELAEESSNFGCFDYRNYLLGRNYSFVSEAETENIIILNERPFELHAFGSLVRYRIDKVTGEYLDEKSKAFTEAVITGETGDMDDSDKELIRTAGVSHLTAVSGMHVLYFLLPIKKLLKNRKTGIRIRSFIPIPFLIFFISVADMSCSVMRAAVMTIIKLLGTLFGKPSDKFNDLGISGLVMMAINPYCIYNSGFVLSYLSIAGIYLVVPLFLNGRRIAQGLIHKEKSVFDFREYLINSLITSVSVNLMLIPAVIMYYGEISVLGIIMNIPASPLTCLIFISGFLLVILSFTGIGFLTTVSSSCLSFFCKIFSFIVKTGGLISEFLGVYEISMPDISFVFGWYLVLLTVIFAKNIRKTIIFVSWVITVCICFTVCYSRKDTITVFDTGQASCALIQTADGKNVLIDTGDGSKDICSLIRNRGTDKIDVLILSHGHSDHDGGMNEIIEEFEIDTFICPDNPEDHDSARYSKVLEKKGTDIIRIKGSMALKVSEAANISLYYYMSNDLNNASIVAVWSSHGVRAAFPADIQEETEQKLCDSGLLEDIDVLIAAHHGSKLSSTEEFLGQTLPEYVIISVGKYNNYGHPSSESLERFESVGAEILRTDENGAVMITIYQNGEYSVCPKIK